MVAVSRSRGQSDAAAAAIRWASLVAGAIWQHACEPDRAASKPRHPGGYGARRQLHSHPTWTAAELAEDPRPAFPRASPEQVEEIAQLISALGSEELEEILCKTGDDTPSDVDEVQHAAC